MSRDDEFLRRLRVDGQKIDARVDGRLQSATVRRTMEGAASIDLVLDDHDLLLIESGLLSKPGRPTKKQRKIDDFDQAAWARFGASRLTLDGWFTRLAGVDLAYAASNRAFTPTFEDEIAALLRKREEAKKNNRRGGPNGAGQTRAQFFGMLLGISRRSVGFERYFCPEISVDQQTRKPDLDQDRQKGFSKKAPLPIQGDNADADQRRELTRSLTVADEENAPTLAVLALICAGIGESGFRDIPNSAGSPYGGVFQALKTRGLSTKQQAHYFLRGGQGFQGGGAIQLARQHPDWEPGRIALVVEGSVSNFPSQEAGIKFYNAHRNDAETILDAWGGVETTEVIEDRREFRVGGKRDGEQHNWWDDMGELAQEVRWRLFADLNILYFVSDDWLFRRRPTITIDRGLLTGGLFEIQATADVGTPVAEIEVVANVDDWKAPPGATVELADVGPLNGRWLLWESLDDRLRDQVTLTLHRPAPKLKEPAGPTRTRTVTPAGDDVTGAGLIYPLSERGKDLGGVAAHKARPFGNWQSDNAVDIGVPRGTKVYAVDDGTISRLGGVWNGGAGNPDGFNVTLKTKNNEWFYTHLQKREPLTIGQKVKAGDMLGRSGAANGVNHLHIGCLHGDPEELLDVG